LLEAKHHAMLAQAQSQGHVKLANIQTCFEILALAAAINRDCSVRLAQHSLSEGKFVLLFLLRDQPAGLSPHALAEQAGVSRATVTGLLDGLERSGLLVRLHNTADRRMVNVQLTEEGQVLTQALFKEHTQWISTLFSSFSADELQTLRKLLCKVWLKTEAGVTSQPPID